MKFINNKSLENLEISAINDKEFSGDIQFDYTQIIVPRAGFPPSLKLRRGTANRSYGHGYLCRGTKYPAWSRIYQYRG